MRFWAREICRRQGATVRPLQRCLWRCWSAIRRIFCVVSSRSTKRGSVFQEDQETLKNSGLHPAKADGYNFLGFKRCVLYRLLGEGQNSHRALLCWIIGPIRRWIAEKRPHLSKKKVLIRHNNEPAYTSYVATAKLVKLGYELLPHRLYSPELAPCDYFLFLKFEERNLSRMRRSSPPREYSLQTSRKRIFLDWIKNLEHH